MYNYLKNKVTLNEDTMRTVEEFNETARTLAIESVNHQTAKHEIEARLDEAIKAEEIDEQAQERIKTINAELEALETAWKARNAELNRILYGGKVDGKKTAGICDIVTDDLYKAYVDFVQNNSTRKYRDELKKFVLGIINGDNLKDGAYNHLFTDIVTTMSSVRYNSNSQLAKGASYITSINKRTYKKMLLGAIHDIVSNNKTLKIKKDKKNNK